MMEFYLFTNFFRNNPNKRAVVEYHHHIVF